MTALEDACRQRSAAAELEAVKGASSALAEYVGIAGRRYRLPNPSGPVPYSSDPATFKAQYFGFFSCEGQGLESIPGSNSCKNKPSTVVNSRAFSLDFDFLTGKPRP